MDPGSTPRARSRSCASRPRRGRYCTFAPAAPTRRLPWPRSSIWSGGASTRTRRRWRKRVADIRLKGRRASPGFAAGEIVVLATRAAVRVPTGDPALEAQALQTAVQAAIRELGDLAGRSTGEEADIIGFQLALLDDAALVEPARLAIANGVAADHAWASALDREIADYEGADDEYFRA